MRFIVVQVFATIALSLWSSVRGFIEKHRWLALLMFTLSLLAMVTILFSGCSLLQVQDPKKMAQHTYRKTLKFDVDGKSYVGTAVLPRKPFYDITIYPEDKMEFYLFQTAHRNVPIEKPKTGWFSNKFTYRFIPDVGLEDRYFVPLEIASMNPDQVKDAFAFIEFRDVRPEVSLPGNIRCNGEHSSVEGTSLCQSLAGTIQQIYFSQKVLIEDVGSSCAMPTSPNGFFWTVKVSAGECAYNFSAKERHKNGERLKHRYTVIGYTALKVGQQ